MLTTAKGESRHSARPAMELPATLREPLDMARRSRYLILLRRWVQERLPAGTRAALDAAEWVRDALMNAAGPDGEAARENGSLLVRLRTRLLADRPQELRARSAEPSMPSSRVEQLIGRDQLDSWEYALTTLPHSQREFAILRIEFGLDFAQIADECSCPVAVARAETLNALAALIGALGTRHGGGRRAA